MNDRTRPMEAPKPLMFEPGWEPPLPSEEAPTPEEAGVDMVYEAFRADCPAIRGKGGA